MALAFMAGLRPARGVEEVIQDRLIAFDVREGFSWCSSNVKWGKMRLGGHREVWEAG
jgi:hypothetical protein